MFRCSGKLFFSLTLSALIAASLPAVQAQEAAAPKAPAPLVSVSPAIELAQRTPKKYAGAIEAIDSVDLIPRVSGVLEQVHFTEGNIVQKGDLLYSIEDTIYQANVDAKKAQIAQCEADLDYANISLARQKRLMDNNASSASSYDAAEHSFRLAQASLDAAKAALLSAETDLSYTKIYAPISGRIGKSVVSAGNLVTPSTGKLASIESISPIYVRFSLSERLFRTDFGGLQNIKERAQIQCVLADGTLYAEHAEIALIDNKIDASTNTVKIYAAFPNADQQLMPGSFVTVLLAPKGEANLTGVLLSALQNDGADTFIYVLDKDNIPQRRNIVSGGTNGIYLEVTSGVEPGEIVVVDGTHKIRPNTPVEPIQKKLQ